MTGKKHHPKLFSVEMEFHERFLPGLAWNMNLLISVSQLARIIGKNHWCPLAYTFFKGVLFTT
jgi:hypothetical protein